MDSVLNLL